MTKYTYCGQQCALVFQLPWVRGNCGPVSSHYDPATHLSYGDVCLDNAINSQFLKVTIKTDPFRGGVQIYLGRSESNLCPVAVTLTCMVRRGNDSRPFFRYSWSRFITRERFVSKVQRALAAAGNNSSKYEGHSFKIGKLHSAVC